MNRLMRNVMMLCLPAWASCLVSCVSPSGGPEKQLPVRSACGYDVVEVENPNYMVTMDNSRVVTVRSLYSGYSWVQRIPRSSGGISQYYLLWPDRTCSGISEAEAEKHLHHLRRSI